MKNQKRYNFEINGDLVSVISMKGCNKAMRLAVLRYMRSKEMKASSVPIELKIRYMGKNDVEEY